MLKSLRRRPTALLLATLLPASLALAACGGDGDEALAFKGGLDAVEISGEVGTTPTFDWSGRIEPDDAKAEVITEGDGEAIADGDRILVDFALANGYTHQVNYDTHDQYTMAATLEVGSDEEPQTAIDLLLSSVADNIKAGQKIGSRIAVTVGSDVLLGDYLGNQQVMSLSVALDIGNEDGLLFVADLTGFATASGTEKAAPAWAPKIQEKDGVPASLDFKGTPAPSGQLRTAVLIEGTGPEVTSGQQILVKYVGQVPGGKEPFDGNFDSGSAFTAVVGGEQASVVKGWSQGLVGQKVGSRVLLEIPPRLGYGKEKQEGIPANSTLYFVVEILDAADVEPAPEPEATPEADPSAEATDGATDGATDETSTEPEPSGTASE